MKTEIQMIRPGKYSCQPPPLSPSLKIDFLLDCFQKRSWQSLEWNFAGLKELSRINHTTNTESNVLRNLLNSGFKGKRKAGFQSTAMNATMPLWLSAEYKVLSGWQWKETERIFVHEDVTNGQNWQCAELLVIPCCSRVEKKPTYLWSDTDIDHIPGSWEQVLDKGNYSYDLKLPLRSRKSAPKTRPRLDNDILPLGKTGSSRFRQATIRHQKTGRLANNNKVLLSVLSRSLGEPLASQPASDIN